MHVSQWRSNLTGAKICVLIFLQNPHSETQNVNIQYQASSIQYLFVHPTSHIADLMSCILKLVSFLTGHRLLITDHLYFESCILHHEE